MSLKYRNSQGIETPVAGLNGTSGELVPSVALVQSGTLTIPATAASGMGNLSVTFNTPFEDIDYEINFEVTGNAWYNLVLQSQKTANGFTVTYQNLDKTASSGTATAKWTAFKLMTDTVHEADAAHIAQNTANFAPAFSELTSYAVGDYCTYNNVLYRCTTAHTAGAWVAGHFTQVTVGERLTPLEAVVPRNASSSNKLVTESTLTPSGTQKTINKNYTNIDPDLLFDTSGPITKTPTELINALKDEGYIEATSGLQQLHCVINFVNSATNNITISDGTHSIHLRNGWIEFEGAFLSGTSTFAAEERWVMKLYNTVSCEMAIVTKLANTNPIMKSVTLT